MAESRTPSATLQILLPCTLVLALSLAPPETRGESAAGCAALIALLAVLGSLARPAPVLNRALLALAALSWPLILVSAAPGKAVDSLAVWVLALAAAFGAARLVTTCRAERWITGTLALAGALAGLHGLVQRFWSLPQLAAELAGRADIAYHQQILDRVLDGRAFGMFSTPAALGGFIALALPVTLVLARQGSGRFRVLPVAAALLQIGGLVSAASATAWISLALALVLAGLAGMGSAGARRLLLVAMAVMVAGGGVLAVLRGAELLNPDHGNNPLRLRAGNIRIAGEMAADHPWIGVGPGGYGERYPGYRQAGDNESRHVHNLPMELAAEFGIPAGSVLTVLFFVMFMTPLAGERRRASLTWRSGVAIGLAAFAIHNLADYTAYMPSLLWLAALLLGILSRTGDRREACPWAAMEPAALAIVLLAAGVAALGGLASNARLEALDATARADTSTGLRHAERAVTIAPWDPDSRLLRGRLYLGDGRLAEASADAETAVRWAPFRPGARSLRSLTRQQAGDFTGAWSDAVEASRLYPIDTDYRIRATGLGQAVAARLPGE